MMKVAPSILSADFSKLGSELDTILNSGADYIHFDVMDGHFVPNLSMGFPALKAVRSHSEMTLDVHLMIDAPIKYAERFCKGGADIVTVHAEADSEEQIREALRVIRANGVKAGVSIKPGTPASALLPYLDMVDLILVMTVEPGFGGQSFMVDLMPKLKEVSELIAAHCPDCELEVDGGINTETAKICAANGANVFVAGSAFFKAADKSAFVTALKESLL